MIRLSLILLALSCASVTPLEREPVAGKVLVGCIAPTLAQGAQVEGTLLPTVVRVLGTYENDPQQWRVLMPGVYDARKWVPVPKSIVRFAGCGAEADAYRSAEHER